VDAIPNGPYYISVSATGFHSLFHTIFDVHFPDFSIAFRMKRQSPSEPASGSSDIWGELQNESGPLVGVRVCMIRGQDVVRCQMTNRLGQYGFTVPSGEYLGVIIQTDRVIARKVLQLKPGPNPDPLTLATASVPQQ